MDDIEEGRRVLRAEAQAILEAVERLDARFSQAVEMVHQCKGKVICTGMGKSGHIARKISSTLSSTGTPSVFLHPAESSHGDLGLISKGDVVIAISNSGESAELSATLQFVQRRGIALIAMTAKPQSPLGRAGQVVLDISVKEEACPLGLAPTTSSTLTLAIGDALAMAVLKRRGFGEADFAEFHPGGKLGRRLLTRVKDVMHKGEALPLIAPEAPMADVIAMMTAKSVQGVAGVIKDDGAVVGIITDGDIRRRLKKAGDPLAEQAKDLMSLHPKTVDCDELAQKALFVMEQFKIQTLFVVDKASENPQRPVGILHIQDLLRAHL